MDSQDLLRSIHACELDGSEPLVAETIAMHDQVISDACSPHVALVLSQPTVAFIPVRSVTPMPGNFTPAPAAIAVDIDQAFLDQLHELRSVCSALNVEEVQTVHYPYWGRDNDGEPLPMEMERLCVGRDYFRFEARSDTCDARYESDALQFEELEKRLSEQVPVLNFSRSARTEDVEQFLEQRDLAARPAP